MSVCFDWEAESARKTEVGKFDVTSFVDEEVLWLEITVHHSVRMAVGSRLQNLIGEALDLVGWERATHLAHVLLQVIVAVFEDQIELILRIEDLFKSIHPKAQKTSK